MSRWCEVVLTISGTRMLGTPAAHSSLTVTAPARHTTTSQAASLAIDRQPLAEGRRQGLGEGRPARRIEPAHALQMAGEVPLPFREILHRGMPEMACS